MELNFTQAESGLSRRERQIMDILFATGRATGQEILERLPDDPSYSSVRTILRILERKGHIRHIEEGLKYVYLPVVAAETARKSAMERMVSTFFNGSARAAVAAFLDPAEERLSRADLEELEALIRQAKAKAGTEVEK